MRKILFFKKACLAIAAVAMGSLVNAETYFVSASGNDNNDGLSQKTAFKTFQYACENAETGDIIAIMGRVVVSGIPAEPLVAGLTIVGVGKDAILDGDGKTPIMTIWSDVKNISSTPYDYFFVNLGFQNAFNQNGGGGAINIDASVKVRFSGCKFSNNKTDCQIETAGSNWNGGAIRAKGANMEIYNCEFNKNQAFSGGAIEANGTGSLIIENSIFIENSTYIKGGGAGNPKACGGALSVLGYNTTIMDNCLFSRNSTYRDALEGAAGGAMFLVPSNGGNVTVINSAIIDNNTLHQGGAISADGNDVNYTFINTTFSGNKCKDHGGAIFAPFSGTNYAKMNIINCTLSGNTTLGNSGHGGGIAIMYKKNAVNIYNSIIEGNYATESGTNWANSDISFLYEYIPYPIEIKNSYIGNVLEVGMFNTGTYATIENSKYSYIGTNNDFYYYSESGISFYRANTERSCYYPLRQHSPAVNGGNWSLLSQYKRSDDQFGKERNRPACSIGAVEAILENDGYPVNPPNDIVIAPDGNITPEIQEIINNTTYYTVSLSSMPANSGTLSGAGTFGKGVSHTVTATANTNYKFLHWKENETIVSTNASYTFTITGDRKLVAVFLNTDNNGNYLIKTKDDLILLANMVKDGDCFSGTTFVLANDIILPANEPNNIISIGSYPSTPFCGTFDGNEKKIQNVYIDLPNNPYQGFFGYTKNAYIRNLGLVNITASGRGYAGGMVAYAENTDIYNSYVDGGTLFALSYCGGLVGYQTPGPNSVITGCSNSCQVTGNHYVGGLLGYSNKGTVRSSFVIAPVSSQINSSSAGAIIGGAQDVLRYSCWFNKDLIDLPEIGENKVSQGAPAKDRIEANAASDESGMSSSAMRSQNFVNTLNSSLTTPLWKMDYKSPINNGFPILIWRTNKINNDVVQMWYAASPQVVGYCSILGQKLPKEPEGGIYIILYDNGKVEKVVK